MSDVHLRNYELDNTYKNITPIIPYTINTFDVLNYPKLISIVNNLELNNLKMFGSAIINNPYVYNFVKNNNRFHGFTIYDHNSLNGNKSVHPNIEPFSVNQQWKFLTYVNSGTFIVTYNDEFKYFCSTGKSNYIIWGKFNSDEPLIFKGETVMLPTYKVDDPSTVNYTYNIHHDVYNNRLIYVNADYLDIYDITNYYECGEMFLIDKIKLIPTIKHPFIWDKTFVSKIKDLKSKWGDYYAILNNQNNPAFIKFGRNIRTGLQDLKLSILNKYSSVVYNTIDLSVCNIVDIIDIAVSQVDDNIIVLHKIGESYYISTIDTESYSVSDPLELKSLPLNRKWYRISYSDMDSNIFNIYTNKEYQSRFISCPTYPHGRLELGELGYDYNYLWKEPNLPFSQNVIQFRGLFGDSDIYNTILASETIKNGKMYMLLHNYGRLYALSQPLSDKLTFNIPHNLEKYFEYTKCSSSSIGTYFNAIMSTLIRDTLNIFNKSTGSFNFNEYTVDLNSIQDFILKPENLYINGNETINVLTLQRIMKLLADIQTKILPTT
jgi:hypothetical protein